MASLYEAPASSSLQTCLLVSYLTLRCEWLSSGDRRLIDLRHWFNNGLLWYVHFKCTYTWLLLFRSLSLQVSSYVVSLLYWRKNIRDERKIDQFIIPSII